MRTAFVTGATGFLGLNVVAELVAQGWRVVAMHRPTSRLDDLAAFPVERVVADVTDRASVESALPRGVDAVFHVAGDTSLWSRERAQQHRNNVEGTANVVAAALRRGARRFVHTSSSAAFGHQPPGTTLTEETPSTAARSRVSYMRTKWLAEQEVRVGLARGLDGVILNPVNIVGAFDRNGWARLFELVRERRLPGVLPGRVDWCHAREVARAHVAAAERGRTGHNYLLGGTEATYAEVLAVVSRLVGGMPPRRIVPRWALRALARAEDLSSRLSGRRPILTPDGVALLAADFRCDPSKAMRELRYRPASIDEMFTVCHDWTAGASKRRPEPEAKRRNP